MSFTKVHLLAVSPRVSPSFESKSTGTSMVFLSCNHSFSTKTTVSCAYICNLSKWSLISQYMMKLILYHGLIQYSNHTYTFLHILRKFLGSCSASLFILVVPVFIWYASLYCLCIFVFSTGEFCIQDPMIYHVPSSIPRQHVANDGRRLRIFNQYIENIVMYVKYFRWLGVNCYVNNEMLSIVVE